MKHKNNINKKLNVNFMVYQAKFELSFNINFIRTISKTLLKISSITKYIYETHQNKKIFYKEI